jgi:hypothetical protein
VGRAVDLLSDPRALMARARTELHRLLGALARKDYEEASEALRATEGKEGTPGWTPERLAAAMAPFYEEHGAVVTTPAARSPRHTSLRPAGERRFDVEQRIVDREGHDDWAIYAHVDLTEGAPPDGPLIELVRLGV